MMAATVTMASIQSKMDEHVFPLSEWLSTDRAWSGFAWLTVRMDALDVVAQVRKPGVKPATGAARDPGI